jgi:hypothetical protein
MGRAGLEPISVTGLPINNLRKSQNLSAADSGAELTLLVEAWPFLSSADRASILSIAFRNSVTLRNTLHPGDSDNTP